MAPPRPGSGTGWILAARLRPLPAQPVEDVAGDPGDGRVSLEPVRPVGRPGREHGAAPSVDAHDSGAFPALFPALVPPAVIRVPPRRGGAQDGEVPGSAIGPRGYRQPLFQLELAAVALVPDDGVLPSEAVAALQTRSRERSGTSFTEQSGNMVYSFRSTVLDDLSVMVSCRSSMRPNLRGPNHTSQTPSSIGSKPMGC